MDPPLYEQEIARFARTLQRAGTSDVGPLKDAVRTASESSVIAVGSGGSFTVASLLCNLHESYTGHVSRVATPLELICTPTLASSSPIFLISAEGKNPDIIEALHRTRSQNSREVHILTNRSESPLMEAAARYPQVTCHIFDLEEKDGYLATNSLLLDAALLARAYGELDGTSFPSSAELAAEPWINGQPLSEWLVAAERFVATALPRKGLIVVFSPLLRAVATDLESKLAESALMYCQVADLRSFAHGRHLWLSERADECSVLSLVEPTVAALWEHMRTQIPADTPYLEMGLPGAGPAELMAALVTELRLVGLIARAAGRDIGRPSVAHVARELYYADLPKLIPSVQPEANRGEASKYEVLGAAWPSRHRRGTLSRALDQFSSSFRGREFRAVVFDYDGTISASQYPLGPPSEPVVEHLTKLAGHGVAVGVASGRGGSVQEQLQSRIPRDLWPMFHLGLYSGGLICGLDEQPTRPVVTSEFLSHSQRIVTGLVASGVPVESTRATHPFQLSVRFRSGVNAESMWFVIADALREAGLETGTVLRSKHSVDILAPGISKSRLIAHLVASLRLDPYQIVTLGDLGAWPGNDWALLEHRFSLSVDMPSRRLDRGWKLAPHHLRDVDATVWYLSRIRLVARPGFVFELSEGVE